MTSFVNEREIPWWKTAVGEQEAHAAASAIMSSNITMGPSVARLERSIAEAVEVPYAVATPSGSAALVLSLMTLGVGPGDEVIVPNRTFIGTANAVLLLGARVVLAPVRTDVPLLDADSVQSRLTSRTKAIIAVHLNGASADMQRLNDIAKPHGVPVVEDACQAMFSRNQAGYLGTQSHVGCYSLGVTKLISCGFGGIVVTRDSRLHKRMIRMRNQGLEDASPNPYQHAGFNFKCSDILAAIGLVQLSKTEEKIRHVNDVHARYRDAIQDMPFLKMMPVDIAVGELPLYATVLCSRRTQLMKFLQFEGIQTRPLPPDLSTATHLFPGVGPLATRFSKEGLILPCGPDQPTHHIERVIEALYRFDRVRPWRRHAAARQATSRIKPRQAVGVGI
jgi:perosamine synthetase